MKLVAKWLLLKPVLTKLIKEAEEELVHQGSYIIILLAAFILGVIFVTFGR